MSELAPTPATPPEPEGTGKLRFHPVAIVVLLALFGGVVVLITFSVAPVAVWFLAVVPIFGGALHAAGHPSEVKTRRFIKAFFITLGMELAVGVIVYGICLAIVSSQI
jgi:sterol desaturase/sphingolipid hydroxylase (fatty acid hydroxylase superfamily)